MFRGGRAPRSTSGLPEACRRSKELGAGELERESEQARLHQLGYVGYGLLGMYKGAIDLARLASSQPRREH